MLCIMLCIESRNCCAPDERALGGAVGRRQAAGAAALVGHRAPHDCIRLPRLRRLQSVAVFCVLRLGRGPQHRHRNALTAAVAVGGGVEGAAAPHRRQRLCKGKQSQLSRRGTAAMMGCAAMIEWEDATTNVTKE